jgi:transcriptional regulator with XRE-family HTH domain
MRQAKGISLSELAARTGMSRGNLARLESQKNATLATLQRYADGLGCELEINVVSGRRDQGLRASNPSGALATPWFLVPMLRGNGRRAIRASIGRLPRSVYFSAWIEAWAAASRAIGTRNGEQLT